MIAIIDYDAGNLKSVQKALDAIGEENVITKDRDEILRSDRVILPGVGAFGYAIGHLRDLKLDKVVKEVCEMNKPFLGICLGMQLLFDESEESPGVPGLGILKGKILKIPGGENMKVPHMGWNSLSLKNNGKLFSGVGDDAYVYFVHSYYLKAEDEGIVTAKTQYGVDIHASVESGNVFACQFHPEKSSRIGALILRNFAGV